MISSQSTTDSLIVTCYWDTINTLISSRQFEAIHLTVFSVCVCV